MSAYEKKLYEVLSATYRLCNRLPGRVSIASIKSCLVKNKSELNDSDIHPLLKGLEELGLLELKMYIGGDGQVKLNSQGINYAEEFEKTMTPSTAETIKHEIETLLTNCCSAVEYQMGVEFNAYDIGDQLGYNKSKVDQYYLRLKSSGYLAEISIPTLGNTKSVVTSKGLDAVQGTIFGQPEGITVNSNEINIHGNVSNSAVAAGEGNIQSLTITKEQKDNIREFLDKAEGTLPDLQLDADSESDYIDHVNSIKVALTSETANPSNMKKDVRGIKRIAEGAAGSVIGGVAATGIIEAATTILALL